MEYDKKDIDITEKSIIPNYGKLPIVGRKKYVVEYKKHGIIRCMYCGMFNNTEKETCIYCGQCLSETE